MATQQQTLNAASVAQQLADVRHDHNDHETRIRLLESKQVVSPKSMWTALGVLVPIVALIVTIVLALTMG